MKQVGVAILVLALATAGSPASAADTDRASAWTTSSVAASSAAPSGYVQFQNRCAICHGRGPAHPGTRALAAKYRGTLPAALEDRRDLTATLVKYTVRHGVSVMPQVRKTELTDADLDAITTYLTAKQR